jgi:site-specific recombinase XerD
VKRPHIELYLHDLERRGYAAATISRRLSTLAGLFKYAFIDDLVPANPSLAVTRAPGVLGRAATNRPAPA